MKVNGRVLAMVLAMVVTFIFGLGSLVEAAQYLGQVTWTWHKTRDANGPTDETGTITVGLFFLGGSYYQLTGNSTEGPSGNQYGGGTAVLEGNNLIMTITWARDRADGRQDVAIFKGVVDKTTFNGTGWNIKKQFDPTLPPPTNQFVDKYGAGTLTLVGSPPPLKPASVAQQLLLLDK